MPTLADLLISNPHGYGAFPPAQVQQGEIRNPDAPASYSPDDPNSMAHMLYQLSGVPMAMEGIKGAREASLAGDPIRTAGNVAQTAVAALPYAGRAAAPLFATVPRLAAVLGGSVLAGKAAEGALSPTEAEASDNPTKGLYEDRARLSQQIDAATQARDQEGRSGKGPKYMALDQDLQKLVAQKAATDDMIRSETEKTSPAALLKQKQAEFEQNKQNEADELNKPFQERHPGYALGMMAAGPVLSAGAAHWGLGKLAAKGESLMAELLQARKTGDVAALQEATAKVAQWEKNLTAKQAATIGISAGFPAESRATQDLIDKYGLPKTSPAQKDADKRLSDPVGYLKDLVPGLVTGAVYAGAGAKSAPSAPAGDARAMSSLYGGQDAPTLAKLLEQQAVASRGVQAPIAQFESALRERRDASSAGLQRSQQLDSGDALAQAAVARAGPPPIALPAPEASAPHHSEFQPKNKKGQFTGPPKYPKDDK